MLGKDLIKEIKRLKLENHDFCETDPDDGKMKYSVYKIISWDNVENQFSYNLGEQYNTASKGNKKVAILVGI